MFKLLFILILTTNLTIQKCSPGCLTCTESDECKFCDSTKNFILQENSCVQKALENCLYINSSGNCLKCQNSSILDSATKKCITITDKIENCQIYSSLLSCEICKKNYFISSGKCEEITENLISNCELYSSVDRCMQCEGDYILSLDKKNCEENPSESNCAFYSRGFCENCNEGFVLDYRLFSEGVFKMGSDLERNRLTEFYNDVYFGRNSLKFVNVCKKANVENCEVFENEDNCQKCQKGFYLEELTFKCIKVPLAGLENCFIYETNEICKECASNHYLANQSSCVQVEPIDNCSEYDGTVSTSICSKCNTGYYTSGASCTERTDSKAILNCKEFDLSEDKCSICEENFVISSDGKKCYNNINNCEDHEEGSSNDETTKCKKCKNGFFLFDSETCNQGDVENCDNFGSRADVCNKCKNTYYLSNNICVIHPNISNCENYSNTENLTCLKCDSNYYNFKIVKICKYEEPINDCIEYFETSPIRCKTCNLNFYLLNNKCEIIPKNNCTKYDGSKCTECEKNYALDLTNSSQPECSLLFTYILSNCNLTSVEEESNKHQMDQAKCLECSDFTYPIDHKNHYVCIRNDKLKQFGIPTGKQESGCLKYNIEKECVQCEPNKFLENKKCVNACASKSWTMIRYKKTGSGSTLKLTFDGYKDCLEPKNNEIYALDISGFNEDNLLISIKCKANKLNIHYINGNSVGSKYSNIDPSQTPDNYIENPIVKYPEIAICEDVTTNSPIIDNCEYYNYANIDGNTVVRCLKCKHGFNSVISEGKKKDGTPSFYLNSCVRDSNLKIDFHHGADLIWLKLFSAHKCSDNNKIPFLAITHVSDEFPEISNLEGFNLTSLDRLDNINASLKSVNCYEDKAASFGYDINNSTEMAKYKKLPVNCALGVINLTVDDGDATKNRTKLSDSANSFPGLAQYCASCQPGYKDTSISSKFTQIKVKCDKIANCSGTEWFNMCSQCNANHVYEWKDDSIDFKSCISNTVQNCYSSDSKDKCSFCKKGYNLNKDEQCEEYTPSNCKSNLNFNIKTEFSKKNFAFGSYKNILGVGCNECLSGYTAVELNDSSINPHVCTTSLYLQQNNNSLPTSTNYIKNCLNYGIFEDRIICQTCISNYVLNLNKDECFNGPIGCEEAQSSSRCSKCKVGYMIENSICVLAEITFCKEYNLETNAPKGRCKVCMENYFLNDSYSCELGEVLNCETYKNLSGKKCEKCIEGFGHYSNGVLDYCFKLDSSLNCKQANVKNNSIYGAELECKVCNNIHELLTSKSIDIEPKTKCMEFSNISNCKTYDSGETLIDSSFNCIECDNNFYLQTPIKCDSRTYTSAKCINYELDQDKCQDCDVESIKNNEGKCEDKPIGIKGCTEYKDIKTCLSCNENMYLENNICKSIANEQLIIGCLFYTNETQCETCDKNYFLNDFKCETAKAKNCLTYTSVDICSSCEKGFGLKVINETTDCIKVNIESCMEFTPKDDFPCTKCVKGYYVDEGKCKLVTVQIPNCKFYENIDTCSNCEDNYAMDVDGKSCVLLSTITSEYDKNCSLYTNKLNCSVCRPGAFFDGASCALCGNNKGCFYCDPSNPEKCLICQSDFYMDTTTNCVANNPISRPDPQDKFDFLKNSFIMILLFLVVQ